MEAAAKAKLPAEEVQSQPPNKVEVDKDGAQVPLAPPVGPQEPPATALDKTGGEVPADAGRREPIPDVKKPPEADSGREKGKVTDKAESKAGVKPVGEKKWGEKGDKVDVVDKKEEKSLEEQDIEAELNAILKRSPSELRYFALLLTPMRWRVGNSGYVRR